MPSQPPAIFVCHNIGQSDSGITTLQCRNTDGTTYWKAITCITEVFGSPISAPLEAYGTTELQARERLSEEIRRFNDSLWA